METPITNTSCCICNGSEKYIDIDCEYCRKTIQGDFYYYSGNSSSSSSVCNILCGGCKKNSKGYIKKTKDTEKWIKCLYCQKSAHQVK